MVSMQVVTPAVYTPWVEANRNYVQDPRFLDGALSWSVQGATSTFAPGSVTAVVTTGTALGNFITAGRVAWFNTLSGVPACSSWKVENIGAVPFTVEARIWDGLTYSIGDRVTLGPGETRVVSVQGAVAAGAYAQPRLWQVNSVPGAAVKVSEPIVHSGTILMPYFDGYSAGTDTTRTYWAGTPDFSQSIYETRLLVVAEVSIPVYETITLESAFDSITFRGDPSANGFVYDNESLQRWYELAEVEAPLSKRPNAHGTYSPGQTFVKEHRPLISGKYFGRSSADAKSARERLSGMFNDGQAITMRVTDEAGVTTSRQVWLVDYDAPFLYDYSYFTFDMELLAPDPRRYGATVSISEGMPTVSSGLVWDLGTAASGLYFDWGTGGGGGLVTFTNTGKATTLPRIDVGGPGAIQGGFRIVEVETGRELTYPRTVENGTIVSLDSRTQRATLGTNDVTTLLSSRRWFSVPRGATRRYQIVPLGTVTGSPIITLTTAPANL